MSCATEQELHEAIKVSDRRIEDQKKRIKELEGALLEARFCLASYMDGEDSPLSAFDAVCSIDRALTRTQGES